ncbi:MAG: hypothetical protein JNM48_03620 [Rhodospirillales bacterium]|nr:hypothetical protein [Rhodospirillales bacterium]
MGNPRRRAWSSGSARSNIWPTFIALNIALFAFFAMMVSASEPEAPIAGAILASVRQTFSGPGDGGEEALFAAGRSTLAELGGDLRGVLRIARISQPGRGSELRVSVPLSSLFDGEAIEPTPAATPLLDRIIAALSVSPNAPRLSAMLTLPDEGQEAPTTPGSPIGLPLAARRAAALAGVLAHRGAPPAAIVAGIGSTAGGTALIVFRFRPSPDGQQP